MDFDQSCLRQTEGYQSCIQLDKFLALRADYVLRGSIEVLFIRSC